MNEGNSNRLDDFSSLFIPDILQQSTNIEQATNVKEEELEHSVQDFIGNENQGNINRNNYENAVGMGAVPNMNGFGTQMSHVGHYANYIPFEASSSQHLPMYHMGNSMPFFTQKGDMWAGNGTFEGMGPNGTTVDRNITHEALQTGLQYQGPPINMGQAVIGDDSRYANHTKFPKKKARKKEPKPLEYSIDYKPANLIKMLDFKCSNLNTQHKVVDNNGRNIDVSFKSFLNGRFFTNDIDNNNFLNNKSEKWIQERENGNQGLVGPKVISCYRRNYIQLLINLNLSGFVSDNKVLKLQSSEYGYTITRVIKWFKIEVSAHTNLARNRNVPVLIKDKSKEKSKEKEKDIKDSKDNLKLCPIGSNEHIILLNQSEVTGNEIDNYYVVKKLQFKSATPNNGNLTFQSYYHLKIKLKAIVADLYYDDYVDDEFAATSHQDNNDITLFELVSEPIIVRGRNPNFYTERKDILLRGRPSHLKSSYVDVSNDMVDEKEDIREEQIFNRTDFNELQENDIDEEDDIENVDGENDGEEENDVDVEVNTNIEDKEYASSGYEKQNDNQEESSSEESEEWNQGESASSNSSYPTSIDFKSLKKYNYFPISSIYYLPPINSVYFPHGAHSRRQQQEDSAVSNENSSNRNITKQTRSRRSSNVYFK